MPSNSNQAKLNAAKELLKQQAHNLTEKQWLEQFCKLPGIDEKGLPIVKNFKLYEYQNEILDDINAPGFKIFIWLKARQLGASTINQLDELWHLINVEGWEGRVISQDTPLAQAYINDVYQVLKQLPEWMIVESEDKRNKQRLRKEVTYPYYKKTNLSIKVFHSAKSTSVLQASSSSAGIRSRKPHKFTIDEAAYNPNFKSIYNGAIPAVKTMEGKICILSTNRLGSYFQELWEDTNSLLEHRFYPWWSVPTRDTAWYESVRATFADEAEFAREYPSTPEEALLAGETAFPEFSLHRDSFVVEPFDVPKHWNFFMALDNGITDPYCCLLGATDEEGVVWVIAEATRARGSARVDRVSQGAIFESLWRKFGIGRPSTCFTGLDAWNNPRDPNQQYAFNIGAYIDVSNNAVAAYKRGGFTVPLSKAVVDRKLGTQAMHDLFLGKRIKIFNTCSTLIYQLTVIPPDPFKPETYSEHTKADDSLDALRYLVVSRIAPAAKPLAVWTEDDFVGVLDEDRALLRQHILELNMKAGVNPFSGSDGGTGGGINLMRQVLNRNDYASELAALI